MPPPHAPGAVAIGRTVSHRECVLRAIDLSGNPLGDEGAAAFARGLPASSIAKLSLGCASIGDRGAAALASALYSTDSLRALHLPHNPIGDPGANALAVALAVHASLRTLDLNHAAVADEGAVALVRALQDNCSLRTLCLEQNNISADGGHSLLRELRRSVGCPGAEARELTLHAGGNSLSFGTLREIRARASRSSPFSQPRIRTQQPHCWPA